MKKLLRALLYIMPACLFLSYHPVISLGGDNTMNFELSVAEIWLVVFDVVGLVMLAQKKTLFKGFKKWWMWVLLPVWLSLSVVWSLNTTRGLLTAGLVWAIWLGGYVIVNLREVWSAEFKEKWWKWFFGTSLVVCGWCVVQCVLDLAGVTQECTLLCDGCTYRMFGFPHPNGFAIEPQFMGNLLLVPMMASAWLWLKKKQISKKFSREHYFLLICFFITTAALFLTFSRGAIYAGMVGLAVMTGWWIWRTRKWRAMVIWPMVGLAFLFTLNLQGVMAQMSGTDDTYFTGIAKVINHLSLGVIDLRVNDSGNAGATDGQEAVFDGYVAESTDTRVRLTGAALTIWRKDFRTAMVGVGLGGAGQALYDNGLSPAPKEIVQNEYASILLETGVVGFTLLILLVVLVVKAFWKMGKEAGLMLGLMAAYMVAAIFFSGLPNVLHMYLLPAVFYAIFLRKKLVS